jgi:hypothetical protein
MSYFAAGGGAALAGAVRSRRDRFIGSPQGDERGGASAAAPTMDATARALADPKFGQWVQGKLISMVTGEDEKKSKSSSFKRHDTL